MEVLLVRHGETYADARRYYRATGTEPIDEHISPPNGKDLNDLNPIGIAQSRALADAISEPETLHIWSSPARRALDTVAELVARLQLSSDVIQSFEELNELQVSAAEYAILARGGFGEATDDLRSRVTRFKQDLLRVCQRAASLGMEARVLVAAHGGTNAGLLALWSALPDERWPTLANGSICRLRFDRGGKLVSASLDRTDHQPESLRRQWNPTTHNGAATESQT